MSRLSAGVIALCTLGVFAAGGCGGSDRPELSTTASHDPELAQRTLVTALDAWKDGKAATLEKRDPPIRFVDDDKISGFKLKGYALDDPAVRPALHQDVSVSLELVDRAGRPVHRSARYQVATAPHLAVLRSDR